MPFPTINNGDTGLQARTKLNAILSNEQLTSYADAADAAARLALIAGEDDVNIKAAVGLGAGQDAAIRVLNNPAGSGAPTVNDDSGDGYSFGSIWIDTSGTPSEIYKCVDATAGAAEWVNTSLTLDDLGSMAVEDTTNYYTQAQVDAAVTLTLNDVMDNTAKRALTGIDPGYLVRITGEGDRIEQYLGGVVEEGSSATVSGITGSRDYFNGDYARTPAKDGTVGYDPHYEKENPNQSGYVLVLGYSTGNARWEIYDDYGFVTAATAPGTANDYPWNLTWTPEAGTDGTVDVEINGIASDDNWLIKSEPSYEFVIAGESYIGSTFKINGVDIVAAGVDWNPVNVGFMRLDNINWSGADMFLWILIGSTYEKIVLPGGNEGTWNKFYPQSLVFDGTSGKTQLPIPRFPRGTVFHIVVVDTI